MCVVDVQLCKKSEDDKDDLIDDVVTDSGKQHLAHCDLWHLAYTVDLN